jgi:hypothetical protein
MADKWELRNYLKLQFRATRKWVKAYPISSGLDLSNYKTVIPNTVVDGETAMFNLFVRDENGQYHKNNEHSLIMDWAVQATVYPEDASGNVLDADTDSEDSESENSAYLVT